jgi:hypothetical protein
MMIPSDVPTDGPDDLPGSRTQHPRKAPVRRHPTRRVLVSAASVMLAAALAAGVPAFAGPSASRAPSRTAAPVKAVETVFKLAPGRPLASIGTQLCPHVTAFVMFVYWVEASVGNYGPEAFCYDGPAGTITPPAALQNDGDDHARLIDVDNQSGGQLWISGYYGVVGQTWFNWCYDSGFDFAFGGPILGGGMEGPPATVWPGLFVEGGTSPCSGAAGSGSTEPGLAPQLAPGCTGANLGLDHVTAMYLLGNIFDGDPQLAFQCYVATGSHSPLSGWALIGIDNGVPHALGLDGSGWTNCLSWNHAIYPVQAAEWSPADIVISSGGGTCTG